jgi:hypothetical protein
MISRGCDGCHSVLGIPAPIVEVMESPSKMEAAGIAELIGEIDAIHHANAEYWRSTNHTREAIAEYQQRQEQLEEIRRYMPRESHGTGQ